MKRPEQPPAERVCLLGPGSLLTGDFATTEELVILGRLDGGCVQSPNVTIGPAARVTADIYAGTIRIEGTVVMVLPVGAPGGPLDLFSTEGTFNAADPRSTTGKKM